MPNNKGFTFVELVVVMAIFIGLILISTSAFENILGKASQQVKSAETQTEGIVGLEMLRSDLEHIGFGLPWTIPNPPTAPGYTEATANPVSGITSANFNDATPRALRVGLTPAGSKIIDGSSNTNPGAAYLVIKSNRVALHDAAKKWAYVSYSSVSGTNKSHLKLWDSPDDFQAGDRVITLNNTFTSEGLPNRILAMKVAEYSYAVPAPSPGGATEPSDNAYKPADGSQLFVAYGVEPSGGASSLRMPYNRADYYLKRPAASDPVKVPDSCNPGTGILFKGVVRHADGGFTEYPLLSCVGDLQVGFEMDTSGYSDWSGVAGMSAADIRDHLKTVRVYILAHEGKKDRNYSYPPIDSTNAIFVGPYIGTSPSTVEGRMLSQDYMTQTFGADWKNYRWKVYTIVGSPKNLQ